jgi:hypothetical protein
MRTPWIVLAALGLVAAEPAWGENAHLPFFHANRDWVLRRFESLEQPQGADLGNARAWSFDPFADESAYARLRSAQAALDSAQSAGDLAVFRAALDSVFAETLVAGARLDSLDRCFARHLRTALEVTLATKSSLDVERIEAWLDGTLVQQRTLNELERAALAAGGVLEVVRRVVEPRSQTLEVHTWSPGAAAPARTTVVVEPEPDRLAVVHLQLESPQQPARALHAALGGGH